MANVEIIEIRRYCPTGVRRIIDRGGSSFIGIIDESTVLKYPCIRGDTSDLQVESQLLQIIGSHPRVIGSKGMAEDGLRLEFAVNGDLKRYLLAHPTTPVDLRLRWCLQTAEALEHLHSKAVIHCDINPRNLLLDQNLDIKLADFQGIHTSSDGKILLDGLSRECSKSYLPRSNGDFANVITDLFALGSAIYFIMMGHEVYPDLDSDDDDGEVEGRFREGQFPEDNHACTAITAKCWRQKYTSAREVTADLLSIHL